MKRRVHELTTTEHIETLDVLYTAAGSLQGRDAVKAFLKDLLTPSERIMLGRRILIARRLLAKDSPSHIASDLKVGYDTIYRVERWLHDQLPGYERAIEEMEKEFDKRKTSKNTNGIDKKRYATEAIYRLKKKYPGHFLFFAD